MTNLKEEFLSYFKDWDKNERPGNYSIADRNMMESSYQTIKGLEITVKSVIECIKFCLNYSMSFALTEKFSRMLSSSTLGSKGLVVDATPILR